MRYIRLIFLCTQLIFYFASCKSKNVFQSMEINESFTNKFILPEWAKSANIYEVNIRQYTPEGSFNAFRKHLERLKEMGVGTLWFMPIFPISETKMKGSLGSYYAVSDFRKTNPKFGTITEFKSIIDEAHNLGMKVILDWVPNHTGWDHTWIKNSPDFYTKDSSGHVTDPLDQNGKSMGWNDVADLNYENTNMRAQMTSDMLFWIHNYNIDGFRQDMALLVPLDYWKETIPKLIQAKPDLFLLAESEVLEHTNESCFHSVYAWSLHHILNDIAQNKKTVEALDNWLQYERPKMVKGNYMHFTSNHDENSWSGSEIERMGEAYKAFAVLVNTIDGIPLTYSGQEEPMGKRLEFFEKDDIGFKNYKNADFYKKLNNLRHESEALWHLPYGGQMQRILIDKDIFAFDREKNESKVTVIINLSNQKRSIKSDREIKGLDIFMNKNVLISEGNEICLAPWEYLVLKNNN